MVHGDAGGFGEVWGAAEEIMSSFLLGSMPLDGAGARGFVPSRRFQHRVVTGFLLALAWSMIAALAKVTLGFANPAARRQSCNVYPRKSA